MVWFCPSWPIPARSSSQRSHRRKLMAKNQSPYTVFVETEDGGTVAVGPDEDLPTGAKIDNPYVTGKKDADEVELGPLPEAGDGAPAEERKAPAKKAAPKSDKD